VQNELLGYAEQEEWRSIAEVVDHDVLFTYGEDRHVGGRIEALGDRCARSRTPPRAAQGT
jgi:hypothetical protein